MKIIVENKKDEDLVQGICHTLLKLNGMGDLKPYNTYRHQ